MAGVQTGWRKKHTVDWSLTAQLLKHFGSTGQSVTGFANGDVEYDFLDTELAHGIRALVFAGIRLFPSTCQHHGLLLMYTMRFLLTIAAGLNLDKWSWCGRRLWAAKRRLLARILALSNFPRARTLVPYTHPILWSSFGADYTGSLELLYNLWEQSCRFRGQASHHGEQTGEDGTFTALRSIILTLAD